jgi:hypothetical protein
MPLALTAHPSKPASDMRLVFSAIAEKDQVDVGQAGYELRLLDGAGTTAMRFTLPADMVEPVVFSETEIFISMTPSGSAAAFADANANEIRAVPITINELVASAVTPKMLEDEPDAVLMLQEMRDRLTSALKSVEAALKNMPK